MKLIVVPHRPDILGSFQFFPSGCDWLRPEGRPYLLSQVGSLSTSVQVGGLAFGLLEPAVRTIIVWSIIGKDQMKLSEL